MSEYENNSFQNNDPNDDGQYHYKGEQLNDTAPEAQTYSYVPGSEDVHSNLDTPKEQPPRKKKTGLIAMVSMIAVVVVACAAILGVSAWQNRDTTSKVDNGNSGNSSGQSSIVLEDKPTENNSLEDEDGEAISGGELTCEQVASKVGPSVVGIAVYSDAQSLSADSYGSGVIMTSDGYIVTNEHVIEGAVGISVQLSDGTELSAEVVGEDSKTDLAVIKVDATNLTAATFGNSDELNVGETVLAIGNPGGQSLYGSVTRGIVSGLKRAVNSSDAYSIYCIQTDAAINPGNSGGALVNMYGQVVGINSSKIAATDYEGIGFAISINDAKPIIDQLMEYGYVKNRVKLGVTVTEIGETLSEMHGVPTGLYIRSVIKGGSVDGSGASVGDIIIHIDGNRIETFADLQTQLAKYKPGDSVTLTLHRRISSTNSKTLDVSVTLQEDTGNEE